MDSHLETGGDVESGHITRGSSVPNGPAPAWMNPTCTRGMAYV